MASPKVLARQAAARENLGRRIEECSRPDFIRTHVHTALRGRGERELDGACRVTIVQNDGTGAATIAYEIDGAVRVFGKLYEDDSGRHSYRVLRTLWTVGFNEASRYQVSEPLGFIPACNLMLIRAADGPPVSSAIDDAGLAAGAREAARWLVQLHATSARIGAPRYPWEVYHKLMHRLAKASAAHPDHVDGMMELADRFERLADAVRPRFVQTHGQFRHIHVFLNGGHVTVIDLDRSRPADPAKDVAEFLHRMRTRRFKATAGASRAEEATRSFLAELSAAPADNLANLPFYWCYHVLVSLWRFMKSAAPEDPGWRQMVPFYLSEFDRAADANTGVRTARS